MNLNVLLTKAVALDASDVHLKAGRKPHVRIHQNLVETDDAPLSVADAQGALDQMIPSHLVERFKASGEVDFPYHIDGVGRFRVNASLAQGLPSMTLRYVPMDVPGFVELNLPVQLGTLAESQRGIVLVCGTTGAGKSTTLAAMVEHLNQTRCCRIITVEDPVEYLFVDKKAVITQREVGLDTDSFESALTNVLRHDPDVIVIGELRDEQSMRTAISAAETGHLVLATLHAANTTVAVHRLLDFFKPEERSRILRVLSNTLEAIIAQRLIPATKGGVVPAVEILKTTPTVRGILDRDELNKLPEVVETGREDGMQSFNYAAFRLIQQGLVAQDEGIKAATSEGAVRMLLSGFNVSSTRRILSK